LATQFLDYEPGIHWSQLQMQSGTTGINTTRVYNPIKQAQDHDPHGQFVKRWLPRMRDVPQAWLFQPWLIRQDTLIKDGVDFDIVEPLVDLATATRESKQRLHQLRQTPSVKAGKKEVIEKHASRKKPAPVSKPSRPRSDDKQQLGFDF
jgi:deoxyribodipyrimidine photo-lyase